MIVFLGTVVIALLVVSLVYVAGKGLYSSTPDPTEPAVDYEDYGVIRFSLKHRS